MRLRELRFADARVADRVLVCCKLFLEMTGRCQASGVERLQSTSYSDAACVQELSRQLP